VTKRKNKNLHQDSVHVGKDSNWTPSEYKLLQQPTVEWNFDYKYKKIIKT
jgi:hypothetical protein